MWLRIALLTALVSTINAGYCSQYYECLRYKSKTSYYSCGLFGWSRCVRYRAVTETSTCTRDVCCPGFNGTNCNTPLCFGSSDCPNNGTCSSPDNCICLSGYASPDCSDIDECMSETSNCEQNCRNQPGSFNCFCDSGYSLDINGTSCNDIDECETDNGGCEHLCSNEIGSFNCSCGDGYSLHNDSASCIDENECETNNGGCQHVCTNAESFYNCSCEDGYVLLNDSQSCEDLNECEIDNGSCEHYCRNENGSFSCDCADGFALHNNSASCVDVNECETNSSGCEHVCTNTVGSFYCSCFENFSLKNDSTSCECSEGYSLYLDNATCKDVNECENGNGGCGQICENAEGTFSCSCASGFVLQNDGRSCIDLVECSISNGGCQQQCINLNGSFSCSCGPGFALSEDGFSCDNITERSFSSSLIVILRTETARHLMGKFYNKNDVSTDREISENVKQMIQVHYENYVNTSFSVIIRRIRKNAFYKENDTLEIVVNYTIAYEKSETVMKVRDRLIRGATGLLDWTTLSYSGITVQAKLDITRNISTVCDVYTRLVGGCDHGFQCTSSDEGPICQNIETSADSNSKGKLIIYILPVLAVVAFIAVVIIVTAVIRKRRTSFVDISVKYRQYMSTSHEVKVQNVYDNRLQGEDVSEVDGNAEKTVCSPDIEKEPESFYSEPKE